MLITQKLWNRSMLKNVSFVILLLKICFVFGQKNVIVIDPGHGGKDSGAIGVNGTYEKDVVLNVAQEILKLNTSFFDGELDIYLTRYKDTLVSLTHRTRLTMGLNSVVFVSLHCNASQNASKGMEVYVHNSNGPNSKASISLGVSILYEGTRKLGFKKRGIGFANFQVLREASRYSPAILVEMGFMTNPDEADYFLKPKNVRAMALVVLMGIMDYLNTGL